MKDGSMAMVRATSRIITMGYAVVVLLLAMEALGNGPHGGRSNSSQTSAAALPAALMSSDSCAGGGVICSEGILHYHGAHDSSGIRVGLPAATAAARGASATESGAPAARQLEGYCGDGTCAAETEHCVNCPNDCGECPAVCANLICETGEEYVACRGHHCSCRTAPHCVFVFAYSPHSGAPTVARTARATVATATSRATPCAATWCATATRRRRAARATAGPLAPCRRR